MKRVAIKAIIQGYLRTQNYSQTAKELGISRWTVRRWVKRGRTFSQGYIRWAGIERKSTKPHTLHTKLSFSLHQEIIALRLKRHVGAKKIAVRLVSGVSSRTIHRLLKKKGLIAK